MNILFDANDQITLAKSGVENPMSYQAPEILLEGESGQEADWYSFGVLLYEMLVGVPAYFDANEEKHFENILCGALKMPRNISAEAKRLIV